MDRPQAREQLEPERPPGVSLEAIAVRAHHRSGRGNRTGELGSPHGQGSSATATSAGCLGGPATPPRSSAWARPSPFPN